jgi:hypothetical protein
MLGLATDLRATAAEGWLAGDTQYFCCSLNNARASPSLPLLHTFHHRSPGDFKAIAQIGQDGKMGQPAAIGRFGVVRASILYTGATDEKALIAGVTWLGLHSVHSSPLLLAPNSSPGRLGGSPPPIAPPTALHAPRTPRASTPCTT